MAFRSFGSKHDLALWQQQNPMKPAAPAHCCKDDWLADDDDENDEEVSL